NDFLNFDVDQEAEPERLQKMKREPFFTVKESQANEIAVNEIRNRPQIPRKAMPSTFEPKNSLIGGAEQPRSDWRGSTPSTSNLLLGKSHRVSVVLVNPEADVIFLAVVFDEIETQLPYRTVDVKVVINQLIYIEK